MVAGNQDIWTIDVARPVPVRLTFHPADDTSPIWSPDGNEIMFSSGRQLGGTVAALYRRSASGAGTDELVYSPGAGRLIGATDWRESGIVFTTAAVAEYTTNAGDVWRLPGSGEGTAERLIASPMRESAGRVSPDGRWILYRSYESGAYQIVVQPYPDISKGKWQVGTRDAIEAKWRADGREIFFLASDGNMMAVDVAAGDTFAVGEPHVLFQTGLAIPSTPFIASRFDVTADGQRFLINLPQSTAAGADASGAPDRVINVVLNWAEALPRRGR
jgi:Tol biopolymer transport system component